MVGKDFEIDDLVWSKMKSFPPWPSKIVAPPDDSKSANRKNKHYVKFFGTNDHAWVLDELISPHSDEMIIQANSKKPSASLRSAIEEIQEESKKRPVKISTDRISIPVKQSPKSSPLTKSFLQFDRLKKQKNVKIKKSFSANKIVKRKIVKKRRSEMNGDSSFYTNNLSKKEPFRITDKSTSVCEPPPLPYFAIEGPTFIDLLPVPELDTNYMNAQLKEKNIVATAKKIGILGFSGLIGRGITKNLLLTGHDVTIWSRNPTPTLVDKFIKIGAKIVETPFDVVEKCDLIFSCLSDPEAVKVIIYESLGVLKGLESAKKSNSSSPKGYVEFSGIDAKTSQDIAKEIIIRNARYLEAPISGSRTAAEEAELLLMVAGDYQLFTECKTSFRAISKYTHYVGLDIGNACNLSLIFSMFKGSIFAAMAEAVNMVKNINLSPSTLLDIVKSEMTPDYLLNKIGAMGNKNYLTEIKLKYQQKDISLALQLGASLSQPLLVGQAANELYKRAKKRSFHDHDVTAVIEAAQLKKEEKSPDDKFKPVIVM